MEDLANLALELISFDTQNNDSWDKNVLGGKTLPLIKHVQSRLLKTNLANIEIQEYSVSDKEKKYTLGERANLVATLDDPPEMPRIMLQGHVDTVPYSKKFLYALGKREEDIISGRGAIDMKGAVAAMIKTFEEISKREDRVYSPILVLTSDEEARNFAGITNFLKRKENLKIDFGICGEASDFNLYHRFKGGAYRILRFKGKSAHGSRPHEGKNAIYMATPALENLRELADYVQDNLQNPAFATSDPHSHKSSLNVGTISGGDKVNTVAESCKLEFELRLVLPWEEYERLLKERVYAKLGLEGADYTLEEVFTFHPNVVETQNVFAQKLISKIKQVNPKYELATMQGLAEALQTNYAGIKTVVFGPRSKSYSHTDNEQISLNDLFDYQKVLISFFL